MLTPLAFLLLKLPHCGWTDFFDTLCCLASRPAFFLHPRSKETGYYSQLGQDRWVLRDVFKFKKKGYFVDLGAADGIDLSNTYILEKIGWKGICIEADSKNFAALIRNRKGINEQACVLDSVKEVVFVAADDPAFGETSHLFGGVKEYLTAHKPKGTEVKMTTVTLEMVLRKYGAPKVIDYLSIDVEGAEYTVLKNFPFHKYRFKVMTVEHNAHLDGPGARDALRVLLGSNHYRLVKALEWEDWFMREGEPEFLSD